MALIALVVSVAVTLVSTMIRLLFPPRLPNQYGPRLNDLTVSSSTPGSGIPFGYGQYRVAGQIIWSPGLVEHSTTTTQGGKGGPSYSSTTYTYTCSFAASFGEGIGDVYRIWGDSKLLYDSGLLPAANANSLQIASTGVTVEAWTGNGSGVFSRADAFAPTYTKTGLKSLMFNTHPAQLLPGDPQWSGDNARPMNNIVVTTDGTYGGLVSLNPLGSGSYGSFDAVITGRFVVSTPGDYPFRAFSDDGWFMGIGPEETTADPVSKISGPSIGLPYANTPKHHYSIFGGVNRAQAFDAPIDNNETYPSFSPSTAYVIGQVLEDGNSNIQRCTIAGTSGSSAPSWRGTPGATTVSGTATFECEGPANRYGEAVMVHFPTAGYYPFEICYSEGRGGALQFSLMLGDCGTNYKAYAAIRPQTGTDMPPTATLTFADIAKYPAPVIYPGNETQMPDPTMEAYEGFSLTPAYRGQVYAVWTDFLLSDFGNRIPNIRAEINYHLPSLPGHTGSGNVDAIAYDICTRAGVDPADIDVSALQDLTVMGYVVGHPTTARNALTPLAQVFFFDAVESSGNLKFVVRGQEPVVTLAETDLGLDSDKAKLTEQVIQEQEIPRGIEVIYSDPALDYQQNKQSRIRSDRVVSTNSVTQVEVPIAIDRNLARQTAEKMLQAAYTERHPYTFNLWNAKYMQLDPTDIVNFLYNGEKFTARLTKTSVGTGYATAVECISDDPENYVSDEKGATNDAYIGSQIGPLPNTLAFLLDTPLLRDSDGSSNSTGYYWGIAPATFGPWPGGVLYQSADDVNYTSVAGTSAAVYHGTTVNALGVPESPFSWDRENTLTVSILQGSFSTTTDSAVLNTAVNGLLVGDEVIQFRDAVQNDDGTWTLSTLLRGRRGTEWACGTHSAGERVIDLTDGGLRHQSASLSVIHQTRYYRGVTAGQDVTAAPSQTFTATGKDLKPYAPYYIKGSRSSGNLTISWHRRTRIGKTVLSGAVPLSETYEKYDVEILNGSGAVVRTFKNVDGPTYTSTFYTFIGTSYYGTGSDENPSLLYTTAQQTADFGSPQATITVRIYQLSAQVGRGFPSTATI